MAGGYAELINVVGDPSQDEFDTNHPNDSSNLADGTNLTGYDVNQTSLRKKAFTDNAKRDNGTYHDRGVQRVRAHRPTDNEPDSTHRTFLHPLFARVLHGHRNRHEVIGFTAMDDRTLSQVTSSPDRFLASEDTPYVSRLMSVTTSDDGLRHKNIRMSRQLPGWMWFILAKSLGIILDSNDKPIFATFLHVVTLTVAMLLVITGAWYTVCDILSEYSKTTVLIGMVTLVIGFTWILLGVYAHKLAGKLFSNKNFAESVRLHSKTFLKISTNCLMAVIAYACIAINAYAGFDLFRADSCKKVQLLPIVCHLMYVSKTVYAFLCVTWTMLVGFVILSVCRTHTIGIRRFMREMAMDAKVYESFWMEKIHGETTLADLEDEDKLDDGWFVWDDQVMSNDMFNSNTVTSQNVFLSSITGKERIQSKSSERSQRMSEASQTISEQEEIAAGKGNANSKRNNEELPTSNSSEQSSHQPIRRSQSTNRLRGQSLMLSHAGPQIMSNDDLLFSYWKMMRRLLTTSRYLQQWLSSWIAFTFIWCADYIIFWATHSATITGIAQFVLPLIVLLILCSAYAEVNAEGQRLIKCICPTSDRLPIISFLSSQPLQMQVFSLAITYNAIMGVILAFSVAFASRIILDEVL